MDNVLQMRLSRDEKFGQPKFTPDAACDLNFELAVRFRDEIADLKKQLRGMKDVGL